MVVVVVFSVVVVMALAAVVVPIHIISGEHILVQVAAVVTAGSVDVVDAATASVVLILVVQVPFIEKNQN